MYPLQVNYFSELFPVVLCVYSRVKYFWILDNVKRNIIDINAAYCKICSYYFQPCHAALCEVGALPWQNWRNLIITVTLDKHRGAVTFINVIAKPWRTIIDFISIDKMFFNNLSKHILWMWCFTVLINITISVNIIAFFHLPELLVTLTNSSKTIC